MSEATSLPVYIQISEMLMREIIAGRLSDGERLLPERHLAKSLNVSVASACLLQRISTRMREVGFGTMSLPDQTQLLNQWIERDLQEKRQRSHRRKLAKPQKDVKD